MTPIRLLIAEDHRLLRRSLVQILRNQPDLDLVAEADNGLEALKLSTELTPDVLLMDVGMPILGGIEATRRIHKQVPEVNILAMSEHLDRETVANMFEAGAVGYVTKSAGITELLFAIRASAQDQHFTSPAITGYLLNAFLRETRRRNQDNSLQGVTSRECEVAQLIAEGRTTKQIAEHLSLSARTIETHRRRVMEKLGLKSIADLTKWAIRHKITTADI